MRYVAESCEKGDVVIFGRPSGEKTLGKVVRINAATYTIEALEERGTKRAHATGGKWRVAKSLVRKYEFPKKLVRLPLTAPEPKRTDKAILYDLQSVESRLSPENLFMDGERSRTAARREERKLVAVRRKLIAELGREPSLEELYG